MSPKSAHVAVKPPVPSVIPHSLPANKNTRALAFWEMPSAAMLCEPVVAAELSSFHAAMQRPSC